MDNYTFGYNVKFKICLKNVKEVKEKGEDSKSQHDLYTP